MEERKNYHEKISEYTYNVNYRDHLVLCVVMALMVGGVITQQTVAQNKKRYPRNLKQILSVADMLAPSAPAPVNPKTGHGQFHTMVD